AGCNGCIGMGQAPATGRNSLRTVPRNFPGRSGTKEDRVFLCSPETATASALAGEIIDPRDWAADAGMAYPRDLEPERHAGWDDELLVPPPPPEKAREVELVKGPNVATLPELDPLPDTLELPVLLKVGDDISTDEIMPAGSDVLPYRSNIPRISGYVFSQVDETYPDRALGVRDDGGHAVVGGQNYGQGSSREHAAIAPRHLGLRLVVAKGFARIHRQNLINFGVLPVVFRDPAAYDDLEQGDVLRVVGVRRVVEEGGAFEVENTARGTTFVASMPMSAREREILLAGGVTSWV
ncbi:MAG: aconitase family protein, partial [Gemmatimonadota bacterium]